jgi:hypothetical protein
MLGLVLTHNMKLVAIVVAMISCVPSLAVADDKGSISVLETSPINAPWNTADTIAQHPTLIMPSEAFTMKDLPECAARELDGRSPMIAPLRVANDDVIVHRPNIQDPNLGIKAVDQQLASMGPRQANTFPVMAALSMLGAALKVTGTSGITVNLPPR